MTFILFFSFSSIQINSCHWRAFYHDQQDQNQQEVVVVAEEDEVAAEVGYYFSQLLK
jgi:hypothetical protein